MSLTVLMACSNHQEEAATDNLPFLDTYFKAFNNHDVEELVRMSAEDIRMMSITPDTVITDLAGKEALETWLDGYFSSLPNVRATYGNATVQEPFISFIETATWGPDSARKQQSSLATYLVKENKIQRVWYYYPE
jgi:hypothetical protein